MSACATTAPRTHPLAVVQGEWLAFTLTWSTGGVPVDLTGYDFKLTAAPTTGGDAVFTASLISGTSDGITADAAAGAITVGKAVTATAGTYSYDLLARSPAGRDRYLLRGTLAVSPRVTTLP